MHKLWENIYGSSIQLQPNRNLLVPSPLFDEGLESIWKLLPHFKRQDVGVPRSRVNQGRSHLVFTQKYAECHHASLESFALTETAQANLEEQCCYHEGRDAHTHCCDHVIDRRAQENWAH